MLLTRQDGPPSISRRWSGRPGGPPRVLGRDVSCFHLRCIHQCRQDGAHRSTPPSSSRQYHLRQHLYLRRPPSTSLGLHNKKLTELMCQSLPASHSLPLACSRRTRSLFNPQTPPTTHSPLHQSGAEVLPGVPFGKRCQWGNMDVSWWWGLGVGEIRVGDSPTSSSLIHCILIIAPCSCSRQRQRAFIKQLVHTDNKPRLSGNYLIWTNPTC